MVSILDGWIARKGLVGGPTCKLMNGWVDACMTG